MYEYNDFSRKLQHLMKEKGVSRSELSEAISTPYTTVTNWVKGVRFPKYDSLKELSNFFGVSISELVNEVHIEDEYDITQKFQYHVTRNLINKISVLNDEGLKQLAEYLDYLSSQSKYRKE